jgi:hypothetical protein
MRSIVLALAFAAPLSAVAATPNTFTTPDAHTHVAKPQTVFVTLVNRTSQDREVQIGADVYKLNYNSKLNVSAPVGTSVKVYSQTNSKISGQEQIQISAADENKSIDLK